MPSRNILKAYVPQAYYHLYNRGVDRQTIFHDAADYAVFMNLLKRHLSLDPLRDKFGRDYRHLRPDIALLAFCLMPNHFHLLVYQSNERGIEELMRSIATAYSMYYNRKYGHIGPVFQGAFKGVLISNDSYLQHISRYIHLNPRDYRHYAYSSYSAYLGRIEYEWLDPAPIMELFESTEDYAEFVADYVGQKALLDEIKPFLADW